MLKFAQITKRFCWLTPAILCGWFASFILTVCIIPYSGATDMPLDGGHDSYGVTDVEHTLHEAQSASVCMKLDCHENSDCQLLNNSNCEQDDSFTVTPKFPQVYPTAIIATWILKFPEVMQTSAVAIFGKFLQVPLLDLRLLTCVFLK